MLTLEDLERLKSPNFVIINDDTGDKLGNLLPALIEALERSQQALEDVRETVNTICKHPSKCSCVDDIVESALIPKSKEA